MTAFALATIQEMNVLIVRCYSILNCPDVIGKRSYPVGTVHRVHLLSTFFPVNTKNQHCHFM